MIARLIGKRGILFGFLNIVGRGSRGVDDAPPCIRVLVPRDEHLNGFGRGIEGKEVGISQIVGSGTLIDARDEGFAEFFPLRRVAFFIVPENIWRGGIFFTGNARRLRLLIQKTSEKVFPPERGVILPEGYEDFYELIYIVVLGQKIPVIPGKLIVVAIRVVIAVLGATEFVAAEDHGRAYGQKERGEEIFYLLVAGFLDRRRAGGAFLSIV